MSEAPAFDQPFRDQLAALFRWRRDVRHFERTPLPPGCLAELLDAACLSPSVGNSQPWRFVLVESPRRRAAIRAEFLRCNADAAAGYAAERAGQYARLKLAGLDEAPVQLAVFVDEATEAGHGLGRLTMPETLRYSAVMAVHAFWLAARARGVGVGWVSIVEPAATAAILEVPPGWSLVAYLCVGWPREQHVVPELDRAGWQGRDEACRRVWRR